jgi:hypothetical protein
MRFAGVATMKINKSKLKDMVEKGVPAVPISVKRKKPEDGSSSAPPAQGVRPSKKPILVEPPLPIPPSTPVVQIHDEEVPFVPLSDEGSTICRSLGLASKRAEAAITDLDFQEYGNARTEDVSKLMVHSLMRVSKVITFIEYMCIFVFYLLFAYLFVSVFERSDGDQSSLPDCGGRLASFEAKVGRV